MLLSRLDFVLPECAFGLPAAGLFAALLAGTIRWGDALSLVGMPFAVSGLLHYFIRA